MGQALAVDMKVAFAYAASGGLYLMQPIMTTRIKSNRILRNTWNSRYSATTLNNNYYYYCYYHHY